MRETAKKLKSALARSPGCLEAALTLKHALFTPPPFVQPGKLFLKSLQELDRIQPPPAGSERRVMMFACGGHWLRICLTTAVALLARNCRVDFAYLPYHRIAAEDSQLESKEFQFYYGRFLKDDLHPKLRFFDLTRMAPSPASEWMEREALLQAVIDAKWALRLEEIDIGHESGHNAVFEFRRRRNLDCIRRAAALLDRNLYDSVLLPHGNLRELGAVYRTSRLMGRPVISFDFKDRTDALVLSSEGPVSEMDTSREWREDEPHVLAPGAKSRLDELMASRHGTEWKGFSWAAQRANYEGNADAVLSRLGISRAGGHIALLCPNVAWDSALLGRDRAFPSLVEWIRQTVAYFSNRTDCRLIVRVHPAEVIFGTGQPVARVIEECAPRLPSHIRVVGPRDAVNTYDLMDAADFGLVYNSTAGLEMAMRGIPTIVAGRPHYEGKGFTSDAATGEDYRAAIDSMIRRPRNQPLSGAEIELAWCYADVFFFCWHKPFPWTLRTFGNDVARWPMEKILSGEAWKRFGPTFDLLAGRTVERG